MTELSNIGVDSQLNSQESFPDGQGGAMMLSDTELEAAATEPTDSQRVDPTFSSEHPDGQVGDISSVVPCMAEDTPAPVTPTAPPAPVTPMAPKSSDAEKSEEAGGWGATGNCVTYQTKDTMFFRTHGAALHYKAP